MQKIVLRKNTKNVLFFPSSFASICASSRPLHLSHIRYFLWKFHRHLGFLKQRRCSRLRLGWGGGGVSFSAITSLIYLLFFSSVFRNNYESVGEGVGRDPLASPGHLSFFSRSSNSSVSPLLRPMHSPSFQFCSARRRGISVYVCLCRKTHPEVSDQMRSALFNILHVVTWKHRQNVCSSVCVQLMQCRCILSFPSSNNVNMNNWRD